MQIIVEFFLKAVIIKKQEKEPQVQTVMSIILNSSIILVSIIVLVVGIVVRKTDNVSGYALNPAGTKAVM